MPIMDFERLYLPYNAPPLLLASPQGKLDLRDSPKICCILISALVPVPAADDISSGFVASSCDSCYFILGLFSL